MRESCQCPTMACYVFLVSMKQKNIEGTGIEFQKSKERLAYRFCLSKKTAGIFLPALNYVHSLFISSFLFFPLSLSLYLNRHSLRLIGRWINGIIHFEIWMNHITIVTTSFITVHMDRVYWGGNKKKSCTSKKVHSCVLRSPSIMPPQSG